MLKSGTENVLLKAEAAESVSLTARKKDLPEKLYTGKQSEEAARLLQYEKLHKDLL